MMTTERHTQTKMVSLCCAASQKRPWRRPGPLQIRQQKRKIKEEESYQMESQKPSQVQVEVYFIDKGQNIHFLESCYRTDVEDSN